jgi:hypothetical protein
MDFTALVLTVVLMAAGFWVLYLVVRAAVLYALRTHAAEQAKASRPKSEAADW